MTKKKRKPPEPKDSDKEAYDREKETERLTMSQGLPQGLGRRTVHGVEADPRVLNRDWRREISE